MQTIEKFRKTKIICTIGPATSDINMIRKLAEAGMNIARLNMSHGDHKFHGDIIQKIKKLNKDFKIECSNELKRSFDNQFPS